MQSIMDLKNGVLGKLTLPPQTCNANTNGAGCDMLSGGGARCHAIVNLGTLAANTVISVVVKESDDNTTWGALSDTANTNTGNLNTSNTQTIIGFQRSKRYIRAEVTISGTNASAPMGVEFLEQRRREPGDDSGSSLSPAA
jgi:hypothetical protein